MRWYYAYNGGGDTYTHIYNRIAVTSPDRLFSLDRNRAVHGTTDQIPFYTFTRYYTSNRFELLTSDYNTATTFKRSSRKLRIYTHTDNSRGLGMSRVHNTTSPSRVVLFVYSTRGKKTIIVCTKTISHTLLKLVSLWCAPKRV